MAIKFTLHLLHQDKLIALIVGLRMENEPDYAVNAKARDMFMDCVIDSFKRN